MKRNTISLTETMQTWPDRLQKSGKTQAEAAAESGIGEGTLNHLLHGKNTPKISTFELFENYLRGLGV